MNIKTILASIILLIISCVAAGNKPAEEDTVKILWVGSSSTYVHDLPRQAAEWLEPYFAPRPVRSYMVGRSGTGFHEYLQPGFEAQYGLKEGQTLVEKIKQEDYDYVVLQMIAYFIGADLKEETEKSADALCAVIRDSGAEPVYYEMGWQRNTKNKIGCELIAASARDNYINYYGPCASAWKKVREQVPNLKLHNLPDNTHPGTLGTYLNLACMYAAITGEKAEDPGYTIDVWPRFGEFNEEEKAEAARILEDTTLDYYYKTLPGWLQKISIMRKEETIDAKIADYLNEVAYQQYKKHMQIIRQGEY
jgi:hypothetical protein